MGCLKLHQDWREEAPIFSVSRGGQWVENPDFKTNRGYCPFGMQMQGLSYSRVTSTENKFLYNGFELDDETGWYDYGWRQYDPQLGRFLSVDPHADSYRKWTPYNYVGNNPINRIDPNGMDWDDPQDDNDPVEEAKQETEKAWEETKKQFSEAWDQMKSALSQIGDAFSLSSFLEDGDSGDTESGDGDGPGPGLSGRPPGRHGSRAGRWGVARRDSVGAGARPCLCRRGR